MVLFCGDSAICIRQSDMSGDVYGLKRVGGPCVPLSSLHLPRITLWDNQHKESFINIDTFCSISCGYITVESPVPYYEQRILQYVAAAHMNMTGLRVQLTRISNYLVFNQTIIKAINCVQVSVCPDVC